MSSYLPPNHNRLLDLEHHLRGQRPRTTSARAMSLRRRPPGRQQQPARQALQDPPRLQSRRSQADQSLVDLLGTPPAPRQSRRPRPQPLQTRRTPGLTAPNPALQNPRQPMSAPPASGLYRQLAAHMGKHHRFTPVTTRAPKNDLPAIPTPMNPEIVETFSAPSPKPARSTRQQRQAPSSLIPTPPPAPAPSKAAVAAPAKAAATAPARPGASAQPSPLPAARSGGKLLPESMEDRPTESGSHLY